MKPCVHAGHVLEAIPSTDLDHERAPRRVTVRPPSAGRRWRRDLARPPSLRTNCNALAGGRARSLRQVRSGPSVASTGIAKGSRFFALNGSIEGVMTRTAVRPEPRRDIRATREHEGVGVLDHAGSGRPRPARSARSGASRPTWQRQTTLARSGTEAIHHSQRSPDRGARRRRRGETRRPAGRCSAPKVSARSGVLGVAQGSTVNRPRRAACCASRLVIPKKSGEPVEEQPAVSMPHPAYVQPAGSAASRPHPALCGGIDVPDHAITPSANGPGLPRSRTG